MGEAAKGLMRIIAALNLAFVLTAVAGSPAGSVGAGPAAFTEIKWPFLMDQWGLGRAFRCGPADCGANVDVYLRTKVGFCNCTTGVADDDEVDRVGDIELLDGKTVTPLGPGRPVRVGAMAGRARLFRVEIPYHWSDRFAVLVALSNKCDAVVATVVTDLAPTPEQQAAALGFLDSKAVRAWAEANTGLQ